LKFVFKNTLETFNDWVGNIISFCIVIFVIILTYETIARYLFNAPTKWAYQLIWSLSCLYFFLGGVYALRHNGHINMDVIYNRFSIRGKAIADLLTSLLFFLFIGILFCKGIEFAWESLTRLENSGPPLYWPIYPVKLFVPIASFLLLLQGVIKFVRVLIIAFFEKENKI